MESQETKESRDHVIRTPTWWDPIWPARYACGHCDVRRYKLFFQGQEIELTDEYLAKRLKCGECKLEESKREVVFCAWCSEIIQRGSAVSLCEQHPDMSGPITFIQAPHGIRVIGCLNMGCADGGMDWAGNWDGDGVRRPQNIPFGDGLEIKPDMQGELYPRIPMPSQAVAS